MSNLPLISIIIPVYKVEKYIHKCVDSVLAQTYKNLEIILVDDGSSDCSGKICDEYAPKDARIKVIHQSNGGISAARNAGIKVAQGEYFSFIDSDDWIDPLFIETLLKMIDKYAADISVVARNNVSHTGTKKGEILASGEIEKVISCAGDYFDKKQSLEMTFSPRGYFVTNKLFKASLFQFVQFPVDKAYEDNWALYRLFQHASKLAVCNEPLYYWNLQNESSVSQGKISKYMLGYFPVIDEFIEEAQKIGATHMLPKLRLARMSHLLIFLTRMMRSNFNDMSVIKPMQKYLRQNLGFMVTHETPKFIAFGLISAFSFRLAKALLHLLERKKKI